MQLSEVEFILHRCKVSPVVLCRQYEMGDLDVSLDAFKHLPYFKPLYTTILRQQMQYLTEQLSRHAGEESMVLTTNLAAGTISSLTSMYGTGFLDVRSDIKKQFSIHCAKNKMKYERANDRGNFSFNNTFTRNHANSSLKRKRNDGIDERAAVTDSYAQLSDVTNTNDRLTVPEKVLEHVSQNLSDESVVTIGIENVRSLQPQEETACKTEVDKKSKNANAVSNAAENDSSNLVVIKENPDGEKTFIVVPATQDSNQSEDMSESQENVIIIKETGNKDLQESAEGDKNPASCEEFKPSDILYVVTEDMRTNKRPSFYNEEPQESMVTKADGNEIWILGGDDSESDTTEISGDKSNDSSTINRRTLASVADSCLSGSLGSVPKQNFENLVHNVSSGDEKGWKFQSQTLERKMTQNFDAESRQKFECSYCSQSFTAIASKKRHERKHTGETPWACEFCDKKFYRSDDLNVHALKHNDQKPYTCGVCGAGFLKKQSLNTHLLKFHDITNTFTETTGS